MANDNFEYILSDIEKDKELSPVEKKLRDRFVEEYFVDYNATSAAIRVGYNKAYAEIYGQQFLCESYVRLRIAKRQAEQAAEPKQEAETDKRRIREMLLREANYHGPGGSSAARVSALSKLMSLYGMDAPIKSEKTVTHKGGVMKVPGISSVEEWEKEATSSQENLRNASLH